MSERVGWGGWARVQRAGGGGTPFCCPKSCCSSPHDEVCTCVCVCDAKTELPAALRRWSSRQPEGMTRHVRLACPLRAREVCVAVGAGAHLHRFIEWVHAVLLACFVAAWSKHLPHREQMHDVRERVNGGGASGYQ